MKQKQRHRESPDKGEESAAATAETPMAKFKALTRGLLNVSRSQLQEEQKRYQESRPDRSDKKTVELSGGSSRKRK